MNSVTVTTLRSINYGAVLQAYSLNKTQRELGIGNVLLDVPKVETVWTRIPFKHAKAAVMGLMANVCTLIRYNKRKLMIDRFAGFIDKYIYTTDRVYTSCEDVESNPPQTDCFICGSDQVFTLRGEQNDLRMLNFNTGGALKFSYAASLGEYNWTKDEAERFRQITRDYSSISVRESQAKEYLKKEIGIDCSVNIDPVLLTSKEEWEELADERLVKEDYILCFPLLGNQNMQSSVDKLKHETGFKVVCVQTTSVKRVKADIYFFDAGPRQFLSLMKNASFVITSSFHGTAFSVIFEKPFYTMAKKYRPERMISLLDLMGMSDRICFENERIDKISSKELPDFSYSRKVIAQETERSKAYLRELADICESRKRKKEE